jgi:type III secretory pathway component EscS
MRRYKLLVGGLLMVGAGAFLIFTNPQALPLWFVWLAGPFLWYVGIAVSIVGIAVGMFLPLTSKEKQTLEEKQKVREEIPVLRMQRFATQTPPAGLIREIPAMGGFLM